MKYSAAITSTLALAFVITLGISGDASAAWPGDAQSILISRIQSQPQITEPLPPAPSLELDEAPMRPVPDGSVMAPTLDGSTAPAMVEPPVVAHPAGSAPESAPVAEPMHPQHNHGHVHQHKVEKKQNFFQKLMEVERKKNAWLRRTFLGK